MDEELRQFTRASVAIIDEYRTRMVQTTSCDTKTAKADQIEILLGLKGFCVDSLRLIKGKTKDKR